MAYNMLIIEWRCRLVDMQQKYIVDSVVYLIGYVKGQYLRIDPKYQF